MSTQIQTLEAPADPTEKLMRAATQQTPWWVVSILAHGLIIAIAALLTLVIEMPEDEQAFVPMVTEFAPIRRLQIDEPALDHASERLAPSTNTVDIVATEPIEIAWVDNAEIFSGSPNATGPDEQGAPKLEEISGLKSDSANDVGQLEDLIGLTGAATPTTTNGVFGEWHASKGSIGGNSGPYGARFESRTHVIMCCCGHRYIANPALRWLANHQEPDGHWDSVRHGAAVKNDTAVTGMALLTLLGAGNTEKVGEFSGSVRKAVAWLKSKQAADGSIWDSSDDGATHRKLGYPHAITAAALAEASGMAHTSDTKAAAQKAIDYCTESQQSGTGFDKGGWRYAPGSAGDLSVTGWYIMALKSAKMSGLKVPSASFDGAINFLDSVEVKSTDAAGNPVSHYKYMPNDEHAQSSHRLAAIGTLARQFLGSKKEDLQASVEWFVNKGGVPSVGANGAGADLYYWYYGSMCVFQQGGEIWTKWNNGMMKTLVHSQCKEGDDAGSWNPAGDYSNEWGRVGQTALSAMCLEVYFRYQVLKN